MSRTILAIMLALVVGVSVLGCKGEEPAAPTAPPPIPEAEGAEELPEELPEDQPAPSEGS